MWGYLFISLVIKTGLDLKSDASSRTLNVHMKLTLDIISTWLVRVDV